MLEDNDATVEADDSAQDTQAEVDWQKRFTDTQAEYTRSQQALKDAESVWEDEQALLARIQERHPHLIAEDETEDVDDDDLDSSDEPDVLTKSEFEAWQAEQQATAQAKENERQFEADLNKFVGDRELDDKGDAWIKSRTHKGPEDLQESVNAWFEYIDSLSGGTKRKKKTTPPLAGGQTATGVPEYGDMKRDEINDRMVARARELETQ